MKIRRLDEKTINQIAAGEVIENTASVVKELVENAFDAGATSIKVETQEGLIRVIDNGCGMDRDDLLLSLERHATSKISQIEDLDTLSTLGFRGEALAAIASVSRCTIITACDENGSGLRLEAEGVVVKKVASAARQRGTTVEISSLFFNVPVRRRFQKSFSHEKTEIFKMLILQSLSRPPCDFSWTHNGKMEFHFFDDILLLEKIRFFFGDSFAVSLFPISHRRGELALSGFLAQPTLHRLNRTGQLLFVNGRTVFSPFVGEKILEGYGTRLPMNRFPCFVLFFTLPSSLIDVNVHPQKKEIRINAEKEIGSFLVEVVDHSFQKKEKPKAPDISVQIRPLESYVREVQSPYETHSVAEEEGLIKCHKRPLAKLGKYLIVEDETGICIVDTARARSRLLREALFNSRAKISSESLLFPLSLEFNDTEKEQLLEKLPALNERGISVRHFGGKNFLVDALPAGMATVDVAKMIRLFLENKHERISALHHPATTVEEGLFILEKLEEMGLLQEVEEGKPIAIHLTEEELEKKFHVFRSH